MLVNKIEALAEGIMTYSGYKEPSSNLYQLRNPGGLKAFSLKEMRDDENLRIFTSFRGGFHALITDLELKCSGKSYSGLETTSTLRELVAVYKHKFNVAYLVKFLRKALQDESITESTPLSFFLGVINV